MNGLGVQEKVLRSLRVVRGGAGMRVAVAESERWLTVPACHDSRGSRKRGIWIGVAILDSHCSVVWCSRIGWMEEVGWFPGCFNKKMFRVEYRHMPVGRPELVVVVRRAGDWPIWHSSYRSTSMVNSC